MGVYESMTDAEDSGIRPIRSQQLLQYSRQTTGPDLSHSSSPHLNDKPSAPKRTSCRALTRALMTSQSATKNVRVYFFECRPVTAS